MMLRWMVLLLVAAALCGCGCRSALPAVAVDRLVVDVGNAGALTVGDTTAPPRKIPKLLRARGGSPDKTEILLNLTAGANPEDLSPAIAVLRAAGYSRIVLVRPRKTSSSAARNPAQPR